jgi:hypothetical protein
VLADRDRLVGEGFPFFDDRDRHSYEHMEGKFQKLAQGVDPDDPWSHPRARELDGVSVSTWLRAQGATYNVVRARELAPMRWRLNRTSAPRCCPICARKPPRVRTGSTTTTSGNASVWRRARQPWHRRWRPSWATEGVSAERLSSLHRQKSAVVAKAVFVWADSFWERDGQNGDVYFETGLIGGTWRTGADAARAVLRQE